MAETVLTNRDARCARVGSADKVGRAATRPYRMLALLALLLAAPAFAAEKPVSYFKDIVPLFKRSCNGCHHPGKLKGDLDLTTHAALAKGGKHGPGFKAGDPKDSALLDEITGDEPSMPKEGDPLSKAEVALVERWIREGARDDTPANAGVSRPSEPPVYARPPVISALAFSPDGALLAVSGHHEVLLHDWEAGKITARLLGDSPRIESVAFSTNGAVLAMSGGAPARFGEIQLWDVKESKQTKSFKVSNDSLFGVSLAPAADRVAFGGADKSVRMLSAKDGKELMKFDNHSDWVFTTAFTVDGKRVLSGSRDRAMKLIDAANGQFIDDINKLLEPVLSSARHPSEDVAAYGGEQGGVRIYKISDNQGRTAANNDVNLQKEFERQSGPVQAVAWSPDGKTVAVGGTPGEVRLYNVEDKKKLATLKGHTGGVFAITFHPVKKLVATGGYEGRVRLFDTEKGELVKEFSPVPLSEGATKQQAAK